MNSRTYDSGADYDAQYSALYEPEIRTLTALALRQGGAVLDLCCGTGIVTVPLAETGLEVVGVDISAEMLATAKAKAVGRENLTFVRQDALEFISGQRFGLALMTGNAFQAFLSEEHVKALLAQVYEHLRPGGVFIFDTRLPEGYDFTLDDDFKLWSEYRDAAGDLARFLVKQTAFDAEHGVLHYEMQDVFADGTVKPSSETLKFTPLRTLLTWVRAAGFEVVGEYQNWHLEPLQAGAAAAVLELRKPN
ncbi:MAG: SAM-dependent methyltransferase [uncultured Truepera sp.]|uniref:SAM-dependent methyltransferase n=1 Tax=uncultured Truepera sp. TaxID=543023 RepID=A0A6J4UVF2_9DEIN|nr:MAG: SAM-dependent methyltransferase [uncultured Truepera sp.]